MKRFSKVLAGTAVLASAAGLVLVGGGVASAATPPWEPDSANEVGTIAFYNSSGVQITGGSINDSPIAAYAVGSGTPRAGDVTANLKFCTPVDGVLPANWNCDEPDLFTHYPITSGAPSNIETLSNTDPVDTGHSGDESITDLIADFPNNDTSTTDGYMDVYQIRLVTANSGGNQSTTYDAADVLVNTANSTYTITYGSPFSTSTTLGVSPSPSIVGSSVTLTATETAIDGTHPAGSVQFEYGTTDIGSPVAVSTSTGIASVSTSALPQGTDSLTAIFTPTNTTAYTGSTGTNSTTVKPPATATTTALAVSGSTQYTGTDVTFTATVTPDGAVGSVSFVDNGTTTLGTVSTPTTTSPSGDTYVLDEPTGLPVGGHSVVATFTPTDPTAYDASSSSPPDTFNTSAPLAGACTQPGSQCSDTQYIEASIPVGTLVISTPYTSTAPLNLGNLVLQANATEYLGTAAFNNIQVTDTRSGDLGWTLSALSSNLSDGGTNTNSVINSQNVGLTGLTGTASNGFVGTVATTDNPAAGHDPVNGPFAVAPGAGAQAAGQQGLGLTPHTVAIAAVGDTPGTYTLNGTLTITAPTSTEAGTFTGTILFTVG